ncbi:ferric uptake regulation protein [Liquorilactobacillus cacaonum DSM 21116]|uniref:Ferric uptake regulation protein n=2 Tax=Liquorilactobacillus cacaonum TaxID=483012 RepID=A0A0R2CS62_9LACO|nr:ferric uptake regulation protein [Liquorilactobacillus cacaonum DSM 21116]
MKKGIDVMEILETQITDIESKLHQAGLKLTPQRRATVGTLLHNYEKHLSAEELFTLVREKESDIGLATVYRTLEILSELGIVNKINFEDGMTRYDLRLSDQDYFHHHLLCKVCGKIQEIHEDLMTDVEEEVMNKFGFKVTEHRLIFRGICSNCLNKRIR